MKDFIKKNFAILLAFSLPVILIIVVALTTYIPSRLLSTKYNFIYTSCDESRDYYYYPCDNFLQKKYTVVDNKLAVVRPDFASQDQNKNGVIDANEVYVARIFLHDTEKNESREITEAEAKMLNLNNLLTSPDGVTVSGGYNHRGDDFFFFPFGGGSSSYGYYLSKGKSKNRLNLINSNQYYYQNNFQFLGWVVPGRN